ncbi:type II toxin-antitoxin system VapC family toxin [Candidatus Bipolaricaulota bacterium]|nr:type II toxin-antitoxin system VapC family toxin [Candidatus Bipolaricaulota bacterium]
MNVVDSSAWLEFFAEGANASIFAEPLEQLNLLLVPSICLYDVFKIVLRQRGESAALQAIALMRQGNVVGLTERVALLAAELSLQLKLPMAASIILATARLHNAKIWTQDADFEGLEGVTYVPKK